MNNWIVSETYVAYGKKEKVLRTIFSTMPIDKNNIAVLPPYNLYLTEINKYTTLYYKLSKISKLAANWDDEGALTISQTAISIGRILIELFEEMGLIEKNIYIHIFPTFNGGIQFELDGLQTKADIEISSDDLITLSKYSGKANRVTEFHFSKNNLQELKRNLR